MYILQVYKTHDCGQRSAFRRFVHGVQQQDVVLYPAHQIDECLGDCEWVGQHPVFGDQGHVHNADEHQALVLIAAQVVAEGRFQSPDKGLHLFLGEPQQAHLQVMRWAERQSGVTLRRCNESVRRLDTQRIHFFKTDILWTRSAHPPYELQPRPLVQVIQAN
jgi:hypothetical protein